MSDALGESERIDLVRKVTSSNGLDASDDPIRIIRGVCLLLDEIGPRTPLAEGLARVALRALETRLLADVELVTLSLLWDSRYASAQATVRDRLGELIGCEPPPQLVDHIVSALASASRGDVELSHQHFEDVVDSAHSSNARHELRCALCGYWFRSEDMGQDRRTSAEERGLVFARSIHPERLSDPLKPIKHRNRSFLELSLDHAIPRAGLGGTSAENLVPMCAFCNGAKMIYRWAFENVSPIIAGALVGYGRGVTANDHSITRQMAVVATIWHSRSCSKCERGASETEITAECEKLAWHVPGALRPMCYDCIAENRRI